MLVKPDEFILKEMQKLNFDYFQIYDCTPEEIKNIKTETISDRTRNNNS